MTELVVIFLLFVAVLAFAWFYLQRAKARHVAPPDAHGTAESAPPVAETTSATLDEPRT